MSGAPRPNAETATTGADASLGERIARNPRPALAWALGALALVAVEFGALAETLTGQIPWGLVYGAPAGWLAGAVGATPATVEGVLAVAVLVSAAVVAAVGFASQRATETLRAAGVGVLSLVVLVGVATAIGGTVLTAVTALLALAGAGLVAGGVARRSTWAAGTGLVVLLAGLLGVDAGAVPALVGGGGFPTLLTRELIPNQGWELPEQGWQSTFLGLSPAVAWALRLSLVYVYAFVCLWWAWRGYRTYRRHYRHADWTPRDDMVDRFSSHYWGLFGFVVVFTFVVFAVFAPVLGPATVDANLKNPYSNYVKYYDEETETVQNVSVGQANLGSSSAGNPDRNVGLMEYDDFGRFHPFGTLVSGKDLFTFMAGGARVSLFIGLVAIGLGGLIATVLALLTAYYKGLADLIVVVTSDAVQSLPRLLLVILLSVVFADHPLSTIYSGGLLLALIFALTSWPFLWRAVRGPAFQIAEEEWIDAARSFGQRPWKTMQKHMAPYILGYLLVYASLSLGGVIIATAALSFLGLGISAPTPEWGRAVNTGRSYIATVSWHISTVPGVMVVVVVTAFNALGDGVRDAIDPQSEGSGASEEAAAAGGGG